VLTLARSNRLHGSKCPTDGFECIGLYLPTSALLSRYSVSKGNSLAQVEKKVFQLLGAIWQQFVATLVLQQGQQEVLRKKLEKTLDAKLPIDFSFEQLKAMAKELDVSYFKANFSAHSAVSVLATELLRFGHMKGTEYGVYASWLELYEHEFDFLTGGDLGGLAQAEQLELEGLLVGEAFAILHGQPMPPRKVKAQELLLLLANPTNCYESHGRNTDLAMEDSEEEETEDIL
jgi:hypothetical protein